MSKRIGSELTRGLFDRLRGAEIGSHEGKIIPIFTLDESDRPHPALLSYYEIVAKNPSTIDMALWKNSSSANNLRLKSKVTMMITDKDINYYIKGRATEIEAEMAGAPQVSRFRVTTEELLEDQESNARITSGMTYSRTTAREADDFAAKVMNLLQQHP